MKNESNTGWKVLVVDDEPDIVKTTRYVLMDTQVSGIPLMILTANSSSDAMDLLREHPDIAVILLDVVMEQKNSGLTLVNYIRKQLNNGDVRIVLRTGQSGDEPELDVVLGYEIDDYLDKGSATRIRLITTVVTSIRAFHQLRQVRQMNARFELLVASVGHDLRSPLQVIQGSLSILERNNSIAERTKRIQTALVATKTLTRLVEDILNIAHGKDFTFQVQSIDLRAWFAQLVETFSSKISARGLAFIHNANIELANIDVDPERLSQCAVNLLDNAIRYTRTGQISLALVIDGGQARERPYRLALTVTDTGCGIEHKDLERIFSPFERVNGTDHPQGTGLGLSIVERLAKGLGGSISVVSAPGQGSAFTLAIPVFASTSPSSDSGPELSLQAEKSSGQGPSEILVVDDDLDICHTVADVLRDAGYQADVAYNAKEALQKTELTRYRIVITDIQMPSLDGFEFGRILRGSSNPPYLIAMTAYMEGLIDDDRSALFDARLKKPFDDGALLRLVAIAMSKV